MGQDRRCYPLGDTSACLLQRVVRAPAASLANACRCTCELTTWHPRQVLRHDIGEKRKVGTVSEAYPHLVLDNFTSTLGQRVANILRFLFPCPKVWGTCCCMSS